MGVFATAIQEVVFLASELGMKQLKTTLILHIKPLNQFRGISYHISPDPSCQLDILQHHHHPFCMYGVLICILKQAHHIGLCHLLQGEKGNGLEMQITPLLLHNFPHPLHEGQFADQEAHGHLKLPDFM